MMKIKFLNKFTRKILSTVLAVVIIAGTCVIPGMLKASAEEFLYEKLYSFEEDSEIVYGNVYVSDSSGVDRQISRAHFSQSDNEELKIDNSLKLTGASTSGYLFNDADGLFELMPLSVYTVSLKVKVVSSQVKFTKNNIVYPVASQNTELKLAYGMPATNLTNKITPDTEVGLIAKVGTATEVFTATQDGADSNCNIGEWHSLTYTFKTPATFGSNGNVLGLALKSFNGVEILIDDINVVFTPTIKVDANGGKISQTEFPHKIGDPVNIEAPTRSFGYDFEGWFYDKACTKEFTDKVITKENCNLTLYAGWSDTHFSFEGYTPSHTSFGFGNHFYDIIEDETAVDGNKVLQYHYTEEYYNAIYSGSIEEGNVVYYSSRRTQRENNISLKTVKPNTSYVVTFKYKVPAGMGSSYIFMATGNYNIWVNGVYKDYLDTRMTLTSENPDVWQEGRLAFTTGDLLTVSGSAATVAFIRLYAIDNVDTVAYLDDVRIYEVAGESTVTLNANGGEYADGQSEIKQTITVGDKIDTLVPPTKENYDFGGWYYDESCNNKITTEVIDGSIYLNTLYAGWSRNMGFEGYYYDLTSKDRNNYVSDTVSIVGDNVQKGLYAAKLTNVNSAKRNVIALNPVNDTTRYLVSFYYKAESIGADVKVRFASMDYNINNTNEVTIYDGEYIITADDADKGYLLGAVIIETAFKNANANRLVMLVQSEAAADYTVYFDTIELSALGYDEGYFIFSDEVTGEHKITTGKIGEEITLYEPESKEDKFLGFYTDRNTTVLYEGGYTYSESPERLYVDWVMGEGFEEYEAFDSNITVTQDKNDKFNKYLTVTGNITEKIADCISGKKYGIEVSYNLLAADSDLIMNVGSSNITIGSSEVGTGWHKAVYSVTATSSAFYLNITPSSNVTIEIDNVVVYEITENMSTVTFKQKTGYGQDHIRIGVKGLSIEFPHIPAHSTDVFYGWYSDAALTSAYTKKTFTDDNVTLYARWAENPVTKVTFDDLDTSNLPFNENNSNKTAVTTYSKKAGTYSLELDRHEAGDYETYTPLANKDGYVRLESNATYAVSFYCYYPSNTTHANFNIRFVTANGDTFENVMGTGATFTITSGDWKVGCTSFTTGTLEAGNDVLGIQVTSTSSNVNRNIAYMDEFTITRVDENRNHIFGHDIKNNALYEIDGDVGAEINYPRIDTNQYEVVGWCNDFELTDMYSENVHKSEKVTTLYSRFELCDINFDNYQFENTNSKYTVGDDISLSSQQAYDTKRSLKYSYNYAVKYFETSNNTAGLGRVSDQSTYRISFRYKLTESQSDVDVKFLTAHLTNRWSFITDYNEATYRIYSGEIGDSWKKATVYLTTDFVSLGTSGLFMTFNPVVEGATTLFIDAVEIDYLGKDTAVVAFLDENNNAGIYKEAKVGESVTAPDTAPVSQFATLEGWYSDKDLTTEYTKEALTSGITYVYGKWNKNSEGFTSYAYKSSDENNYAQNNSIENGTLIYTADAVADNFSGKLRLGKLKDNTSYKISFDYKADSENSVISFATANEMNIKENITEYLDEGSFVNAAGDNQWHSEAVYITSSFAYTVPDGKEEKNAVYGDMLYMYFNADKDSKISIDNIKVEEVEALYQKGASVLTEEASKQTGAQAMRFYFGYKAENSIRLNIGGEEFILVERGIIYKNARNSVTGVITDKGITVNAVTLSNAKSKGHIVTKKTYGFGSYWSFDDKEGQIVYSGYITDYRVEDTRPTAARGYIKVKDANGNIYTFYSADKKTNVKENSDRYAEITDKKVHTFGENSWANFTIVNPKLMPYIYGEQIELLIDYAKKTHNVDLPRVTEKAEETEYEIVIGDTKREASKLVEVTEEDKYVIAMIGTKLIIKGGSDLATMQGVKDFIEYLEYKDSLDCGAYLFDGFVKEGYISKTADDYALTFNDEFEGSTLNRNFWGAYNNQSMNNYNEGDSCLGGTVYTRAPGDPGFTTATGLEVKDGIFLRDGNCILPCARLNDTDFVTPKMSTFWNMIYQYGMFEISVKIPEPPANSAWWINGAAHGSGFTSLFGREARGCMTEYDLLENFGLNNYYASNIHYWWSSNSIKDLGHSSLDGVSNAADKNQYYVPDNDETDMYDNYHIYTFLWNNDSIVFALDGVKYYTFENDSTYFDRMPNYIILSAGLGSKTYGAKYDITKHKDYYENLIDYVRVYQVENMGSRMVWANRG